MLDNFLKIIGLSSKKKIVNLYICVIYRRASHAGPSAPLCFARMIKFISGKHLRSGEAYSS